MKTLKTYWRKVVLGCLGGALAIAALKALADVPQPVLKIAPLGSNQFSILITNGVSTTNYTLFWRYQLENPVYPWTVVQSGSVGQTNFAVDAGLVSYGFFRVLIGDNADGDGSPEWQDAQPWNPNVGALNVVIDSPINGTIFQ